MSETTTINLGDPREAHFHFDASKTKPMPHFWTAVGSDGIYPEILDENGAFLFDRNDRFGVFKFVRNHHTLSELWENGRQIGGDVYREDENGNPIYDFTYINSVFAECVRHGVKPVVEMDYIPKALARPRTTPLFGSGDMYERCSYPADWDKWRALLVRFTENLIETFGAEEVRTWYFEVWNEPDLCALIPFIRQWVSEDWEEFMHLYDVFVDAVTSVDPQLKVGGPGGCTQAFMFRFFEHVARGKNYVTGEIGTRIDFISYHYYGMTGWSMPDFPMESTLVNNYVIELRNIYTLMEQFPQLHGTEFHLNEWGESAQGGRTRHDSAHYDMLRNTEFTAIYMVKLINTLMKFKEVFDLNLTQMLYWGFAGEEEAKESFQGTRSLSTYPHIVKPLWTVQEMLSFLGDRLIACEEPVGDKVGSFAFASDHGFQIAAYNFDEAEYCRPYRSAKVDLTLKNLKPGRYTLYTTKLGKDTNNTFALYQPHRDNDTVTEEVLREVQNAADWRCDSPSVITVGEDGTYNLQDVIADNEVRFYYFYEEGTEIPEYLEKQSI